MCPWPGGRLSSAAGQSTSIPAVAIKHHTEQIPIERVENGMSLAVEKDGHIVLFQVNSKGFSYKPDGPTIFVLKSEVLENGEQWVIEKPAGTMMTRVLRETYDDGT